MFAQVPAKN